MSRTLAILALLATCGLHAAIKKAEAPLPAPPKSPPAKAAEKPSGDFVEELRKRAQRDGGKLRMNAPELAEMLRGMLEKQGVPKEQIKDAGVMELLELLREKNPDALGGLGFGGTPFSRKLQKQLNDHFQELLEGHRPGAAKAAPATFQLRDGGKPDKPIAFATGVNAEGWLLSKASEVRNAAELQCEIQGAWQSAKIIRFWEEHDLALVKVAAKEITVAQWAAGPAPAVGSFVTAVAPEGRDPVAIGVVSVAARNDRRKGSGYLGLSLASDEMGLKVRQVIPGGAANASGMQAEDRILELDGKKQDSVFTFIRMVSERRAGDKVRLKLQRGSKVMEKEIALGDRAMAADDRPGFDKLNGIGSTVSKRKDDFPSVLQTDLPLEASQCGGPVTDLDGNVIGLVIARSGRVETMVIPSETIRQTLAGVDFAKENRTEAPKPAASPAR
ncbi:MAG: PDZ domain-containing protein [Chthoniobacteraceae bacterium]